MTKSEKQLTHAKKRLLFPILTVLITFTIIVTRLWSLQVIEGDNYKTRADNNRVRSIKIAPPRGRIIDRNDREIVTNRATYNVVWVRNLKNIDDDWLKSVSSILGLAPKDIMEKIRQQGHKPKHIPIKLMEDVGWEIVARVESHHLYTPGLEIAVTPERQYHLGNSASHVLGYLGIISKKELLDAPQKTYHNGALVGKMGLERLREKELRGEPGESFSEVNARGYKQRSLGGVSPLPGNELRLTIDMEMQKVAEHIMIKEGRSGAVVAMDPNSGRILTLASSPVLPLNDFTGGISYKAWNALLNNPLRPLVNKAVQGQYPPASTYKLITAIAGLAEGVITPERIIHCPGHYQCGSRTFHCWKRSGHGDVNLKKALAESCDVYFYQIGQELGVDTLARYARMFGLGKPTGIEMEYEKSGLIPTTTWKKERFGTEWQEGETLSVAIGQGFNLVTPVQLALMTSTIANGGTLYKPTLVEEVRTPDGQVMERFKPVILHQLKGQSKNLKIIREGLIEAVHGKKGTGKRARLSDKTITVAGKTGTAQVVRLKKYKHLQEKDIPYKYRDHALFVCFAPAKNPEIVVSVVVEHGLHGGTIAARVAKAVLEQYFASKIQTPRLTADMVSYDLSRETDKPH